MTSPRATPPGPAYPAADAPCPCGSGRPFGQCCGPILRQERPAGSAEQLMRSRFTAHAIRDYLHLHRSYLETAGKPYVEETDVTDLEWKRLVIHSHEAGPRPDTAFVDFTAFYAHNGAEHPLQEKSEFQRVNGQWYYSRTLRQGPAPVKSSAPKVGRNDPCPCGSGKKSKHCCAR